MKKVLGLILIPAVTLYLALIYSSETFLVLFYFEFFFLFALLFLLAITYRNVEVNILAPIGVASVRKKVPVEVSVTSPFQIPIGRAKVRICCKNTYTGKKKKTWVLVDIGRNGSGIDKTRHIQKCTNPGNLQFTIEKVEVTDLLGLFTFRKRNIKPHVESILVLPELYEVPVMISQKSREFCSEDSDVTFQDEKRALQEEEIREYRPGDKIHSIHWKLTAKTDELMVKQNVGMPGYGVLFYLDIRCFQKKGMIESFLQIAASLSRSMIESECPHFVIWYHPEMQAMERQLVSEEEDVYQMLLLLGDVEVDKNMQLPDRKMLTDLYQERYQDMSMCTKVFLDEGLCLWIDEVKQITYHKKDLKRQLENKELIV